MRLNLAEGISRWLFAGLVLFVIGAFLLFSTPFRTILEVLLGIKFGVWVTPLGVVLAGIGIFLMLGCLGLTYWKTHAGSSNAPQRRLGPFYVLSKFAMDRRGNMTFPADYEPDLHDDPEFGHRFHVQVALEDGTRLEFKTSAWVYFTIPEGSRGFAEVQGDWIGRFELLSPENRPAMPPE